MLSTVAALKIKSKDLLSQEYVFDGVTCLATDCKFIQLAL